MRTEFIKEHYEEKLRIFCLLPFGVLLHTKHWFKILDLFLILQQPSYIHIKT